VISASSQRVAGVRRRIRRPTDRQPPEGRGRPNSPPSAGKKTPTLSRSTPENAKRTRPTPATNQPEPHRAGPWLPITTCLLGSNAIASRDACQDKRWTVSPSSNSNLINKILNRHEGDVSSDGENRSQVRTVSLFGRRRLTDGQHFRCAVRRVQSCRRAAGDVGTSIADLSFARVVQPQLKFKE